MPSRTPHALIVGIALVVSVNNARADWKAADGPLMTRWTKEVSPDNALPEYPRPQLVRKDWTNLNGLWQYAIRPRSESRPEKFDGDILVPFAIESALSGVMKKVGADNRLWYRRTFETPEAAAGKRLLLHFEAVDWHAIVWVNGKKVGDHKGGYSPFSCDITDALVASGDQEILVAVWDPCDKGFQPRGKQVSNPRGIWYTSVTGIWQTVWLEPVSATHIRSVKITPDIDEGAVQLDVNAHCARGGTATFAVTVLDGGRVVSDGSIRIVTDDASESTASIRLPVENAKLWSPDTPFLYDLQIRTLQNGRKVDEVASYFGMRKIALATDDDGFRRMFLNNEPLFHLGPLDQGWWPDGLYTAPTDAALRYDVEITRKLGFNCARKHVKIEPARWYYHCDRLGLMVWQDMPSGDRYIGRTSADHVRTPESAENFYREYRELIDSRYNHPSIVVWVPFNEGWGQFQTNKVLAWTKSYDPTRLVDGPSGWTDRGTGDLYDIHSYPGPAMPSPEKVRAVVLGEFGGLGQPIKGHLWWNKRNWGYRTYEERAKLWAHYDELYRKLARLHGAGLAAAIYTQTTDVEGEVNGLLTYDRAIVKYDVDHLAAIHRKFYRSPPIIEIKTIVPSSREKGQTWKYTTQKPPANWSAATFNDADWNDGVGGFGEKTTPGSVVRTEWKTSDIWLRRTFSLATTELAAPHLLIHHDEDAEVYLNGKLVAQLSGYESDYVEVPLNADARGALRAGENTLAVHCHQTRGGQYIDVGLVEVTEKPRKKR